MNREPRSHYDVPMRLLAFAVVALLAACAKPTVTHDGSLDFGDVALGESGVLALKLTNPSDEEMLVHVGDVDGRFVVDTRTVKLSAKGSAELSITFTPAGLGIVEDTLKFQSTGGESFVTLNGRGVGALVDTTEDIDLGRLQLTRGDSRPVPLIVRNSGTSTSTLEVTVSTDDAELCVQTNCETWSATLDGSEAAEVPVRVTPTEAGLRVWRLRVQSNEALMPVRTVTVRANVEFFEPCDFRHHEPIVITSMMEGVAELSHQGSGSCLVTSMTLSSTPDVIRFADDLEFPMIIERGVKKRIRLDVVHPRPLAAAGVLSVFSPEVLSFEIPIRLTETNPCLTLSPSELDFGSVSIGCPTLERTVNIYNSCSAPVTLESVAVEASAGEAPGGPNCPGTTQCPEFTLVNGITAGTVLQPSEFATMTVRYQPINFGPDTGAVVVRSGAFNAALPLLARGSPSSAQTDTYRSDPLAVSDVVFMVDTSPSFAPRRANVRSNIESILSQRLATACVDLRVAFAPADGDVDAGVTFARNDAGSVWSSNQEPDFVNRALAAFDALPTGSEIEACVGPAAQLVQQFEPRDGGVLAGFCVTDALEQSPNPTAALNAFSGGRAISRFSWNTVTATSSSACAVESIDDGVHHSLASSTFGVEADVCDDEWYRDFAVGSTGSCGPRTTLYLMSQAASAATIEVRVNGTLRTTGWTYDASLNAIVFAPNEVPAAGTVVTVTYNLLCAAP